MPSCLQLVEEAPRLVLKNVFGRVGYSFRKAGAKIAGVEEKNIKPFEPELGESQKLAQILANRKIGAETSENQPNQIRGKANHGSRCLP